MRALIGEKPCYHNCVENTKKIYAIAYAILNGTGNLQCDKEGYLHD